MEGAFPGDDTRARGGGLVTRDLDRLARTRWDVIVIGGGIYGVCAAREAALRGLRACVLERGDFGGATSSRSLKIVHGGIRYLQHLDLVRMRQSILERRRLLALAPHLVRPLACVVPTHGYGIHGRAAMAAALAAHDLVGFDRNSGLPQGQRIPRGRVISRNELLALFPGLPAEGLTGGALWHDAQAWSTERLLVAFLASAAGAGAQAANHVEVERFLVRDRCVEGIVARDLVEGRAVEVRGRVVLNAAGPWVDRVLSKVVEITPRVRFHASRAFNLVVRPIVANHAIGIPCGTSFRDADAVLDKGARVIFLVPWRGMTLVGTRHLPHQGSPDACSIARDEVDRLLAEVNAAYPPARLTPSDVVAVHAGVLPENPDARGGDVQLAKHPILIDHAREDAIEGLVTMAGVKWTTARLVAADALDLVAGKLGAPAPRALAQDVAVAGGDIPDFDRFLDEQRRAGASGLPAESIEPLLRSHGTGAIPLMERARKDPALAAPVHDGSPKLAVEVLHAVEAEMAVHLDDVVMRRAELWLGAGDPAEVAERCAQLVAGPLGWDGERRRAEVRRAVAAFDIGRSASLDVAGP